MASFCEYLLCKGRITGEQLARARSQQESVNLPTGGCAYAFGFMDQTQIRRVLGIRRLMLEGGGTFNGEMLHAGLVDEISQVVVPVVDGGRGVTTIFDIPGDPPPKAAAALRLKSHRTLPGGVSWFRYRVARRSGR